MKGDDLRFANKLSLVQRHAEAAQLNLDTLNELIREMVGGFDRMQRILTEDELRAQMTHANGGNSASARVAHQFMAPAPALLEAADDEELEPLPVKPKRKLTPAGLKKLRQSAAHAREVRLARLNGQPEPPTKAAAKAAATNGAKAADGLIPVDTKKLLPEFNGMFPYPYFLSEFLKTRPRRFTLEDVVAHGAGMGYLLEPRSMSQCLSHQASLEVIMNTRKDPHGRGRAPGIYILGKTPMVGRVPTAALRKGGEARAAQRRAQ